MSPMKRQHVETSPSYFREVPKACGASRLTDGVVLATPHNNPSAPRVVVMPWIGFGTYKIGNCRLAEDVILKALQCGYRAIDTAFIYGRESTELAVGRAIQRAISTGILLNRSQVFVTTKHWREYHGYEPTLTCLDLSLQRLQLLQIDLWLMHWPGPAWKKDNSHNNKDKEDVWNKASMVSSSQQMDQLRSETWRAMEDACRGGKVKAIGVSNMSVHQLRTLKETATLWPPAVNQVELHPLRPQLDLIEYCRAEGIVLQAYGSLGGQDIGSKGWSKLLGKESFTESRTGSGCTRGRQSLLNAKAVVDLATNLGASPAQILLKWGLAKGCSVIPKASTTERMLENIGALHISLSDDEVGSLSHQLLELIQPTDQLQAVESSTRLCWINDPLRFTFG